jgi:hypothetical protein
MSSGGNPIRPRAVLTSLAAPPSAQESRFPPKERRLPPLRRSHIARSCQECRRRKIKCDRGRPCSYCVKSRVDCAYLQGNQFLQPTHHDRSFDHSIPDSSSPELKDQAPTSSRSKNGFAGARPFKPEQGDGHGGLTSSCFLFAWSSLATNLQNLHPTPERIFSLWQTYLENVDPLLKIFHVPTVQKQIVKASHALDKIGPAHEALLFSIYYAAITSMRCPRSPAKPQEDRNALLAKYRFGTEQALARADFLANQDLSVLQALVLYLICIRRDNKAPYCWTLTSLAIRIAIRLGLHRDQDQTTSTLSQHETELRRRLWWQIHILDVRTALDGGTDPSLYEHMFNVFLPSNVNDADLEASMGDPPTEIRGRTEMLLSLVRFETSSAVRRILFSEHFCKYNSYPLLNAGGKIEFINGLEQRLEDRYLQFCDVNIPVCLLAVSSVRLVMKTLKLVTILNCQRNFSSLPRTTKDSLFTTSIEILEYADMLKSDQNLQRWSWLFQNYVEWDALICVLYNICERVRGEDVDRAWSAVGAIFASRHDSILDKSKELRWHQVDKMRLGAIAIYHRALIEESRDADASVGLGMQPTLLAGHHSTVHPSSGGLNLVNNWDTAVEPSYADVNENSPMLPVHASGTAEKAATPGPVAFVGPYPLAERTDWANLFQGFAVDMENGALTCWL